MSRCAAHAASESNHMQSDAAQTLWYTDASVKGLVVYLSTVQFLPYNRIASFFKEVFGLEISQGSIAKIFGVASLDAAPIFIRRHKKSYRRKGR